jgi:hypothetical protein
LALLGPTIWQLKRYVALEENLFVVDMDTALKRVE